MPLRLFFRSAVLVTLVIAGGCTPQDPYVVGDVLVARADGQTLGKVIEIGDHHFPSGIDDRAVLVQLEKDQTQVWYSLETLPGNYTVVGR